MRRELQLDVERQHDVGARHGCLRLDAARVGERLDAAVAGRLEHAALRVDDLLPVADLAVQPVLVGALDAGLADVRRAGVVAAVDALEIRRADAADVADGVRRHFAERIVARQRFLDVDAREQVPAHGERCRLLLGEVAQLDALETAVRADEIAEVLVLRRVDEAELFEREQRAVEIVDLLADGDELPVRAVLRNHEAVAVVDEPARRRHRLDAETIALRQLDEVLVVEDLQLHEPPDDQTAQEQHDDRRRDDARQEQPLLLPMVLQL